MAATPIFIAHAEQAPYGLPVPGSLLYKVGIHPSGPAISPDAQHQEADSYLIGRLSEVARRYLPGYDCEPAAAERCIYDNTPDEDFILGRAGNVVVGCGTSGHGFKFGPLLGRWLADLAAGPAGSPAAADPGSALDPVLRRRFSLDRFRPQAGLTRSPRFRPALSRAGHRHCAERPGAATAGSAPRRQSAARACPPAAAAC